jgi:F0F1-type ATP synthase assembly protein I
MDEPIKRFKIKKELSTDAWWRGSMFFFFDVSGYIVGPLIVAYLLGDFIDKRFGTEPWGNIVCLISGFIISTTILVVKTIKYLKELEKDQKK